MFWPEQAKKEKGYSITSARPFLWPFTALAALKDLCLLLLLLVGIPQGQASGSPDTAFVPIAGYAIEKYLPQGTLRSSGEGQHNVVGERTRRPFLIQVTDSLGGPVKGARVFFEIVMTPDGAEGCALDRIMVFTNSSGVAQTHLRLGNKEGEYQVVARIQSNRQMFFTLFTVHARPSNWVIMLFVGLVGGLALFFLGIKQMSSGLMHSSSERLRSMLERMSKNRMVATLFGALITIITQSSSATTVMLVGFVQSKLVTFSQTVGMIFGAAIGTTVTVQLISFRLADYSLLILALGFALLAFSKRAGMRNTGESMMGFGMLFYGMHIMSMAMSPLRSYEPFLNILSQLQWPLLGILVGTLFTAIIQSSAAFIGIVLALSSQGLISLEMAIPLLMGANVGTSVTGIIASVSSGREAKKVALAYTMFKVIGVLLLVGFIQPFADLVRLITPDLMDGAKSDHVLNIPRQIANAHTIYNVLLTMVVLPFSVGYARFIDYLMPRIKEEKPRFKTRHIDENLLSTPSVAIKLAKQEVLELGVVAQQMVNDILKPFVNKDKETIPRIMEMEDEVNYLRDQINTYLIKITRQDIQEQQIQEAFQVMYVVKEFEQVADLVSKNLIERAKWWVETGLEFSAEGKQELEEFHHQTRKQLKRAFDVFDHLNLEKARKQHKKYGEYKRIGLELEHQHFERLKEDVGKSVTSSKTHLELVSMLRTIGSHANNIAQVILEWPGR